MAISTTVSQARASAKRRSYTLQYKLSVVEWIENHDTNLSCAARKFGVDRKLLRSWVAEKAALAAARSAHGPSKKKLHNGRPPRSADLDRMVLDYVIRLKEEGVRVCDRALRATAVEYARALGISDFKAAPTWLKRWRGRHCATGGGSSQLSHMGSRDSVQLSHDEELAGVCTTTQWTEDGPLHYDFTTPEHCYCRRQGSAPHPLRPSSAILEPSFHLGGAGGGGGVLGGRLEQEDGRHFHPDLPPLHFDDFHAASSSLMSSLPQLEFALDHEEIVGELSHSDSNAFMLQQGSQTSGLDPQMSAFDPHFPVLGDCLLGSRQHFEHRAEFDDCLELPCLPTEKTDAQKKGKGRNLHKKSKRAKDKTGFPVLDGPSGLLASRLSQPVFPAEPEFVFFDHDTHTSPH